MDSDKTIITKDVERVLWTFCNPYGPDSRSRECMDIYRKLDGLAWERHLVKTPIQCW